MNRPGSQDEVNEYRRLVNESSLRNNAQVRIWLNNMQTAVTHQNWQQFGSLAGLIDFYLDQVGTTQETSGEGLSSGIFCVRCKKKTKNKSVKLGSDKKGRSRNEAICSDCGSRKYQYVKKVKTGGIKPHLNAPNKTFLKAMELLKRRDEIDNLHGADYNDAILLYNRIEDLIHEPSITHDDIVEMSTLVIKLRGLLSYKNI